MLLGIGSGSRHRNRAIDAFWDWWRAEGAAAAAAAIEARQPMSPKTYNRRVNAIDRRLSWAFAPGRDSKHVLMVSADGVPELRALARRWLLAAPPADETWSYVDYRPPIPDLDSSTLAVGAVQLDLRRARVVARVRGPKADVTLYHPAFGGMLPEHRGFASMLMLDSAVGERAVDCWIGVITSATEPVRDDFPLSGLQSVIDELERTHLDSAGRPGWLGFTGEFGKRSVVGEVRALLKPAIASHLDRHVIVSATLSRNGSSGMSGEEAMQQAQSWRAGLESVLGDDGWLLGHYVGDDVCTFHFYVDSTTEAEERVEAAARRWPLGRARVAGQPDPAWQLVSGFHG